MSIVPPPPLSNPAPAIPVLLRVPGGSDLGNATRIKGPEKEYSVSDIVAATHSDVSRTRLASVKILGSLRSLNRSELHHAVSTLYALAHEPSSNGVVALEALTSLLEKHLNEAEGIHLGVQIIKKSFLDPRFSECISILTEKLADRIIALGSHDAIPRREFLERRYILLRAVEAPALRDAALEGIQALLENPSDLLKIERKELAGNLLGALRLINSDDTHVHDLKRLASIVFASGFAPTKASTARATDFERTGVIFTTSHNAEGRKQFGLATTLEIRKAIPLIGRGMILGDVEHAFRFGTTLQPGLPVNMQWFNRAEWNTAVRLLAVAMREEFISGPALPGLYQLLATRVKVEDPGDPRDSKNRPNLISAEEREKLLCESELLQQRLALDPIQIVTWIEEAETRLLSPEFRVWRYVPVSKDRDTALNAAKGDGSYLVKLLMTKESPVVVQKLTPEELHILGHLQGLSLDEFRTITSRLRNRAIMDEWARIAVLDLVRSPHAPEVTAEIRTTVLGALVADARRANRLTPALEKEVFAVSAEIPALSFLASNNEKP